MLLSFIRARYLKQISFATRQRRLRRRKPFVFGAQPAVQQLEDRVLLTAQVTAFDGSYSGSYSGNETHTDSSGNVTVSPIQDADGNLFTGLISNGTFTGSDPGVGGVSTATVNAQGELSGTGTALNVFGQRFPFVFSGTAQSTASGVTINGTFSWNQPSDVGQGTWTLQSVTPPALPVLSVPNAMTVNGSNLVAFSGANAISVTDAAGSANDEQLTLSVNNGTLTLVPTSGSQIEGSGSQVVTITGTLTQVNADLLNLSYAPTSGSHVSDTLTATVVDTTDQAQGASAQVSITPDYVLQEATQPDPFDILLTYDVNTTNLTQLPLEVYRSQLAEPSTLTNNIAAVVITNPQNLTPGEHINVKVSLNGAVLSINPSQEYVDIVGNPANGQSTGPDHEVYFRTYVLGVIAHGFELPWSSATPAWETTMASSLRSVDHYDDAIAFNWMALCWLPLRGEAVKAGDMLFAQVVAEAHLLAAGHPGDVVDLHFIGHSRGAVVVDRAMQDLVGSTDPALAGSYIAATFLDPHPASLSTISLFSGFPVSRAFLPELLLYELVSVRANDPQIIIPPNVNAIEVYYQHSSYLDGFIFTNPSEFNLNLWGEGPDDGIINQSTAPIQWHNLSHVIDTTIIGPQGRRIGAIGHSEVPLWYEAHIVAAGLA